jgi:hypothetical protein
MKKTLFVLSVIMVTGSVMCWAEEADPEHLATNQEVRANVASGEKKIAPAERFKARVAERTVTVPQIQSRAREMRITTDVSSPKFTSRQREMQITDHGARQIQAPKFRSVDVAKVAAGAGERKIAHTSQLNNMQINYMGKIMEGRVDYLVNKGERP